MTEYNIYTQDNKYMERVAVRKEVPSPGMARQLQEEQDTLIEKYKADKVLILGVPALHAQWDKKSIGFESVRV